jgi:hypothetical protein
MKIVKIRSTKGKDETKAVVLSEEHWIRRKQEENASKKKDEIVLLGKKIES